MTSGKNHYVAWKFGLLQILKEKGLSHVLDKSSDDKSTTNAEMSHIVTKQGRFHMSNI